MRVWRGKASIFARRARRRERVRYLKRSSSVCRIMRVKEDLGSVVEVRSSMSEICLRGGEGISVCGSDRSCVGQGEEECTNLFADSL